MTAARFLVGAALLALGFVAGYLCCALQVRRSTRQMRRPRSAWWGEGL